jgi:diacylglycerol kinase family enzyme
LINTSSFADTLSFYKNLEKKRKEIFSVESDKIIMKFDGETSVQLDGDVFENIKQLDISIIPKKLKIIIPDTQ